MKTTFLVKMFLIVGTAMTAWSQRSEAVPLLGETAGSIKYGPTTLYKDHANPNKVYFFPNSTKFSRDSSDIPLFSFVYWGLDSVSAKNKGAFMTLTTHLASDDEQTKSLQNYMAEHPQVEVSVLPIKSSTIGLQKTGGGDSTMPLSALFTEFNFARKGGRAEDEIGINAVLNPVGARAFKALLTKARGGSKLKFDYCYNIQGYGPSMDATIIVDMKRAYEYFETNTSVHYFWFSAGIRTVTEKLLAEKSIRIEKHGGDATDWEYLKTIADTVTARLFQPELSATPTSGEAGGNRLFRFTGGYVKKEEHKTETWTWKRTDLEEREFCTAVAIKDLDPYIDQLVISADQFKKRYL